MLLGADYIWTADADKNDSTTEFKVTVSSPGTLYMTWRDSNSAAFPSWATALGFTDTGENALLNLFGGASADGVTMSVYSLDVAGPGVYTFEDANTSGNFYTVIGAVPEPSSFTLGSLAIVGLLGPRIRRQRA